MESKHLTTLDTRQPDAVEKYVGEPLMKLNRNVPMDEENMRLLMQLNMFESGLNEDTEGAVDDLYNKLTGASLPLKIFIKRLENSPIKVTKGVACMMGCLMETPGVSVLCVCYFLKFAKDNNLKEIDLETWSMKMFPFGFFKDEDLHKVWDAQKVKRDTEGEFGPDNLVDYGSAFISLMQQEESENEKG